MTIPLQQGIIYGPVNSRRLGRSLGVNIVSTKIKTCTFNCVYWQYGLQRIPDEYLTDHHWYPSTRKIIDTLGEILPVLNPAPAYITFSGNGEATLHPDFPTIVNQVKQLREKYTPQAAVAILSNSSTVITEEIREALSCLDRKIMKLDCGDEETFKRYNQPLPGITLRDIIEGLKQMDNITIQALFAGGGAGNYSDDHIRRWVEKITEIAPADVQIYTLDRSYPSEFITPLSKEELLKIKDLVTKEEIRAEVF